MAIAVPMEALGGITTRDGRGLLGDRAGDQADRNGGPEPWRNSLFAQAARAGGEVELEFVAGAGHSDTEPGLVDAMVRATDRFKEGLTK